MYFGYEKGTQQQCFDDKEIINKYNKLLVLVTYTKAANAAASV